MLHSISTSVLPQRLGERDERLIIQNATVASMDDSESPRFDLGLRPFTFVGQ